MALILHIMIALSSVIFASYLLFSPDEKKLRISYALVVLTIATGTYLVFLHPAKLIQACTSGLIYVIIVTLVIGLARSRLQNENF